MEPTTLNTVTFTSRNEARARGWIELLLVVLGVAMTTVVSAPARADVDVTPELVVWGPDTSAPFEGLAGVAVEPMSGEFAVSEGSRGRILFFGLDGWLLGRAEHKISTPAGATHGSPAGLAYDHQGNLLVVDRMAAYVDVLDYLGTNVTRLELPAPSNAFTSGRGAVAVAVAPDGRILVGTHGDSARIHEFSPDYDYLGSWGSYGSKPGQLNGITGIAVGPDGQVVVACARTENGIQIFDSKGNFIKGFGVHQAGEGNVSLPGGVAISADGRIWVADEMRQIIQVFDSGGLYLGSVGGAGQAPGDFLYPSAIATDGGQHLIVAERLGSRVQVLRIR